MESDLLLGADWDIPLTDAFVAGVHRGVRRRRLLRRATIGVAAAFVAFVVAFAVTGSSTTTTLVVTPATPQSSDGVPLGHFRIGYVPGEVRASTRDGSFDCAVAAAMRECRDPGAGGPAAAVYQRRYDDASGAARMWVTVLEPLSSPGPSTQWLVDWLTNGTTTISTFDAPAGRAQVRAAGTSYSVVLTTDSGTVISITGNATLPRSELTNVARGITPVN